MHPQEFISVLAAAVLAAVTAALLVTAVALVQIEEAWNIVVVSEALLLTRMIFAVALAHALALGVPLFFLLRPRFHFGIISSGLTGFLIGTIPFAILASISMVGLENASRGGRPTVVDGAPTLAGLIDYALSVGSAGLFGLAGGITFWAFMRLSGQGAGKPTGAAAQSGKWRWSIVSLAALLTAAVFILPRAAKDTTCHNLLRDGRTSIGPQISADIKLNPEDWPVLTQIFTDFGTRHSLSFRRDEKIQDRAIVWRTLNLCDEAGVNISAAERPWLDHPKSPLAGRGISFSVYEMNPGSAWNSLARDLFSDLERRWPHKTTFRGRDGNVISMEEALQGRR